MKLVIAGLTGGLVAAPKLLGCVRLGLRSLPFLVAVLVV